MKMLVHKDEPGVRWSFPFDLSWRVTCRLRGIDRWSWRVNAHILTSAPFLDRNDNQARDCDASRDVRCSKNLGKIKNQNKSSGGGRIEGWIRIRKLLQMKGPTRCNRWEPFSKCHLPYLHEKKDEYHSHRWFQYFAAHTILIMEGPQL